MVAEVAAPYPQGSCQLLTREVQFNCVIVHVRFMMDEVTLGHIFLRVLQFSWQSSLCWWSICLLLPFPQQGLVQTAHWSHHGERFSLTLCLFLLLITPWSRVFSSFYETHRFITMFNIAYHWTLSWARLICATSLHPSPFLEATF
jgi:hypothetical protein